MKEMCVFSRLTPVSLQLFPEPPLLSCCHSHSGCVVGAFGSARRAPQSPSHVCATASLEEVCWASARYSTETSSICLHFYHRCSCQQEIIITILEKLQVPVNNFPACCGGATVEVTEEEMYRFTIWNRIQNFLNTK